jgi:hypothetical protein
MSEQAPDRLWSGIDIPKTVAGVLAAISAAVVGSFLGVAGTLVGAAVASVISSVGTELYQRSIHRSAKKLQTIAPTFIKVPAAVGTPSVAAATEADSPSHTVPERPKRNIRWGRIAMIAGALFVLTMGTLTAVELISKRSVASWTGHGNGSTTTFGGVVTGGNDEPTKTPPSPIGSAPASQAPDAEPTTDATTQPATDATTGPTPAVEPTADAPTQPDEPTDGQQQPDTLNEDQGGSTE